MVVFFHYFVVFNHITITLDSEVGRDFIEVMVRNGVEISE